MLKTILDNFLAPFRSLTVRCAWLLQCPASKKMLEFPDELIDRPWVYFEDLIRFNVARGEYGPGVPEEQVATGPLSAQC